ESDGDTGTGVGINGGAQPGLLDRLWIVRGEDSLQLRDRLNASAAEERRGQDDEEEDARDPAAIEPRGGREAPKDRADRGGRCMRDAGATAVQAVQCTAQAAR